MNVLKLKFNLGVVSSFNRDQLFAVGGFCALLMVCAVTVVGALGSRADALQHLTEQRDQLAALEARSKSAPSRRVQAQNRAAPAAAFLDAPTSGLATAQFQAYLSDLVASQRAVLVASGVPADRDDKTDAIRLQISFNATLPALQSLLYRLESGVPYVFVDALLVQPGGSAERTAGDAVLKVSLTVHAFWRRKTA